MKKLKTILFLAVMIISADTFGQIPIPQIIGNNNDCDDATYTVANPNALYTYTWTLSQGGTISSGNGTSTILVKFTHITGGCNYAVLSCTTSYQGNTSVGTIDIYPCCNDNATYIFNNYTTTFPVIIPVNSTVIINGDFIMNHNVSFSGSTVYISPNSKIKLINNDITLTVDNSTISSNIDCCTDMWDGIYANSPTQRVNIVNGSTITNAQNALNLENGTSFFIDDVTFIDNYRNINIKEYYATFAVLAPQYPGSITKTSIIGNQSLPYPPYYQQQTFSGIETYKVNNLAIGDNSDISLANSFRNMFVGIKNETSYISVQNNDFVDINIPNPQIPGSDPTQIYQPTAIFTATPASSNSNLNWFGLYANNNRIRNSTNGIYSFNMLMQVENNLILADKTGVFGKDLYDNSFVSTNDIWSSDNNPHVNNGIMILNVQPRDCNYRINSNTINAKHRGISINSANTNTLENKYVMIYSNLINLNWNTIPLPDASKPYMGIQASSCYGINIFNNQLGMSNLNNAPATENFYYGISIDRVNNGLITNNPSILYYGAGINVYGDCNFTQFFCNKLNNCYYGFLFNKDASITSNGFAYPYPNIPTDNEWIGNYQITGSLYRRLWATGNSLLTYNNRWYVRTTPPPSFEILNNNIGNPTNTKIVQASTTNTVTPCASLPQPNTVLGINIEQRKELYENVVRDSNNYTTLDEQYKTYDAQALYKTIKADANFINKGDSTDILYQQFYAAQAGSNIEKISEIEALIKDNQDSLAILKNEAIQDGKMIDEFRKTVNEIYLTTFARGNYNLSQYEIDILMPIATNYTPWEGGDAVYIARNMLNLDFWAINADYAISHNTDKGNSNVVSSVKLYPNPASDEVMIEFDSALKENAILEIYGFTANLLQTSQLSSGYKYIAVSVKELKAGIYYFRIISNNGIISYNKLLIVK